MCAPLLNRLVALILTVALTVMGVVAASARGQTTVDGHALAHCSAGGLVQPTLDAKGHPTGGKHLCPDLAAGLFATAALAATGSLSNQLSLSRTGAQGTPAARSASSQSARVRVLNAAM